ncbi:histidine phosphatase family protein [Cellulomonas sp. NPDC089187]|uniref:histidine phosphatase family protein n=1 Tax=Cellulomonas sp. NPDC089187 TaxID=3154970 RepID=UPI003419DF81
MATTLHLVRHAQTVYNTQHVLQGWSDSPLTEDGLAGIRRTAAALADVPFVAAYASPLGRTITSAREILAHHPGVELIAEEGIKEFDFGDWETLPEADLAAEHEPVAMWNGVLDGTFPGLPGAEPTVVYHRRVAEAFARIERAHTGDVLVVSHGVTLFAYLSQLTTMPLTTVPNGSVTTVRIGDDGHRELIELARNVAGHGIDYDPLATV